MESSWSSILTVIYLLCFTLSQLLEVIVADFRSLKSPETKLQRPPENGRIISLLAQYLPISTNFKHETWWQLLVSAFAWTEPFAIIYFSYIAVRFSETRLLLICLLVLGFVLLNNVWKTRAFSLRKKLRLTVLLPAQLIPYYVINLAYSLGDIYKLLVQVSRAFTTRQLNFPLQLRLPEKHH